MATTKSRKVTNGPPAVGRPLDRVEGYFGAPERLKSGGATADDYEEMSPQSTLGEVNSSGRHPADSEPGRAHSGWPEKGT